MAANDLRNHVTALHSAVHRLSGRMHRRKVAFRVLENTRSSASAASPQLSRQFVLREAAPTAYRLPKWSQLEPSKPLSRPSHPPPSSSGTSLLTRASSVVQPLRAPPPKTSTSKWLPEEKSKPPDSKLLTRSLERTPPTSTSGPRKNTRSTSAKFLSRTILPVHTSNFLRDAAPHSSMQEVKKPALFFSDPRTHQSQQRASLPTLPDRDVDADAFHKTDTVPDFAEEAVTPSSSRDCLGDRHRPKRPGRKGEFKERGSLLHSSRTSIPSAKHKSMSHWQQLIIKKDRARDNKKIRDTETQKVRADLYIPTVVTVGQFARLLNVRLSTLQRKMVQAGMREETSYDHVLTSDYAALLAEEFGRNPIVNDEAAFDLYPPPPHPTPHLLPLRPPVITIMGHVDHGKTTLLDTLRSSSVAASEAGGITQHIGAFCVPVRASSHSSDLDATQINDTNDERLITFLDTPGHAAFSAMRARGTSVTDIVVLVVAADDGVMPQTLEVIDLVNREKDRGNVGMVVAINKVDKEAADVERTKQALLAARVSLEEYGGDVPCVEVSGLTGRGLPDLIETLALMADVMDLRAERDCSAVGYVLESKVQKGLGPVATVLISRGTLTAGTPLLAGTSICSTRLLLSPSSHPLSSAGPGTPVLITGWKSLPSAGDEVLAAKEADIKRAKANRLRKKNTDEVLQDVEAINATRRADRERGMTGESGERAHSDGEGGKKELKIVVKGDVSGSVEALVGALEGIGNHLAGVRVVFTGVGDVTESDIMMAKTIDAMVLAFSVSIPRSIQNIASQNSVVVHSSDIIYRAMDHIRGCVISMLPCTYETKVVGEATVIQLFDIHTKGKMTKKIAGCRVGNGVVQKMCNARIIREGQVIHEGSLHTLRHLKKDVTEVGKGSECGINLLDFDDLREGDLIQMVKVIEIPGEL